MPANDTICAPMTPPGRSAVGVVRLSGPRAAEIARALFSAPGRIADRTAAFGYIVDGGRTVDSCVLTVFFAPHSYTGEDVAELSCHGAPAVINEVIRLAVTMGARPAAPGEFTRRAFLNGKLDLARAESVMELIDADNAAAARAAAAHLSGSTSRAVGEMRSALLDVCAAVGAYVDFPDDETDELSVPDTVALLDRLIGRAETILRGYDTGRILRDGVTAAIIGRANAGKSSLMNLLSGADRSIVSAAPGTTRDVIEQSVLLGGVRLILADTAGIRTARAAAEAEGVRRALAAAGACSLTLCVFDNSRPLNDDDRTAAAAPGGQRIAIINKCDLPQKIDEQYIITNFQHYVKLSALTGEGLDKLEKLVKSLYLQGLPPSGDVIMSRRQADCLTAALQDMRNAREAFAAGVTPDAAGIYVDGAVAALGGITGSSVSEDVVGRIFERFCVGK